jgi:hypothetical protein
LSSACQLLAKSTGSGQARGQSYNIHPYVPRQLATRDHRCEAEFGVGRFAGAMATKTIDFLRKLRRACRLSRAACVNYRPPHLYCLGVSGSRPLGRHLVPASLSTNLAGLDRCRDRVDDDGNLVDISRTSVKDGQLCNTWAVRCLKEHKLLRDSHLLPHAGDWIDTNFPKGNPTESSIANPQQLFPLSKVALEAHALSFPER